MPGFFAAFDLGPVTKTMAQLVTPLFNLSQGADGLIAFFQGLGGNQPSVIDVLVNIFTALFSGDSETLLATLTALL